MKSRHVSAERIPSWANLTAQGTGEVEEPLEVYTLEMVDDLRLDLVTESAKGASIGSILVLHQVVA